MTLLQFILVGLSAVAAGIINALAGGGTLITFPMLTAIGIPPVAASITNTVALSPGYLGATMAQAPDLKGQRQRLWLFIPISVVGGIIGGLLLLNTGERVFRSLVPFLILLSAALLAAQGTLRKWLMRRSKDVEPSGGQAWLSTIPVGLAAIYGGYFGAGLSVIVLAVLGVVLDDTLTRLNALKQAISFGVNLAAALFFVFSGQVIWSAALVMAVGALLGGALGGKLAGRIQPDMLRRIVVTVGVVVALIYFVR